MGTLRGFGLRTYRVLVDYTADGELYQIEFGGVRATSVLKAKEQARGEFVEMTELPEEAIQHVFAVMVV